MVINYAYQETFLKGGINLKRNRLFLLIIIFSIFFISACVSKTIPKVLIFSGESDNWEVQYEVEEVEDVAKDEETSTTKGFIKYIGAKPIPEDIKVSISTRSEEAKLNDEGILTLSDQTCRGYCATESENSEIEAVIEWNNEKETLPLELK